jgi:cytochrome c peroxidase
VYEASVPGLFGNRKPPASSYATLSPVLDVVVEDGEALFVGGNFWDGRATGHELGNPAADQAKGPFLNPLEQALPDAACVVQRICTSNYAGLFKVAWGAQSCRIDWPAEVEEACSQPDGEVVLSAADRDRVEKTFNKVALSIAAFEDGRLVNQFSSKFDDFLKRRARLTSEERRGLELFRGKALCDRCHVLERGPGGTPPLLTDFTFDNLGVPRNPENPFYAMPAHINPLGRDWVDLGLGGFLSGTPRLRPDGSVLVPDYTTFAQENLGKQKVPTLRNVDRRPGSSFVKAYMHNGYFKSLKGVVHFYNTRDVKPRCVDPFTTEAQALAQNCWPEPEVFENVNVEELGNLGLTSEEEDALVAFMKTLSDRF